MSRKRQCQRPYLHRSASTRKSHADTVIVQRESTISSTRSTGPCWERCTVKSPASHQYCAPAGYCLPLSSARAVHLFSRSLPQTADLALGQALRKIRDQIRMPKRWHARHPSRRWLRVPFANHFRTDCNEVVGKMVVLILPLRGPGHPSQHHPIHTVPFRAPLDDFQRFGLERHIAASRHRPHFARLDGKTGSPQKCTASLTNSSFTVGRQAGKRRLE